MCFLSFLPTLVPRYKDYRGKIEALDKARSVAFGEVSQLDDDIVEITELPPQVWTEAYKETGLIIILINIYIICFRNVV